MKMHRFRAAALFLGVALAMAVSGASAQIVIGQSAPLSGGNAELGNDIRNGALAPEVLEAIAADPVPIVAEADIAAVEKVVALDLKRHKGASSH